jgi:hypothetical protein
MTLKEAQSRVYMFDINGLLESNRKDLVDFQKPYAHQHAPMRDFVDAIESIKPTTIIGVSTIGGAFTQKVVEAMSRINERPVILALSNPTEHAECTPEQAYTWSKGKALYAAGVQFEPVHLGETLSGPDSHETGQGPHGHLLGEWDGKRTRLLERGVRFDFQYISDSFWNIKSEQKVDREAMAQ